MKTKLFLLSAVLLIPLLSVGQTVVATYQIHDHASGLAYDGHNIWYGRYGTIGERIYKFDTSLGLIVDSLDLGAANLDDAYGMTWDGQYLWVTNHVGVDFTLKVDTLGNIISSYQNPSDYMSGLAWSGTYMYMGDYYNPDGAIYKCSIAGGITIVESFTAPDLQPWDLAWDGQYLWMCDYNSNVIYRIDPVTHLANYNFLSPMQDPAGLAWDGQYLWVCDEGQGYSVDNLYKIAPFGTGTPEIQLSIDEIAFGYVPLGSTPFSTLTITNIGTADLTVTGMPMIPAVTYFWIDSTVTVPFVLNPNGNHILNIFCAPVSFGPISTVLHIQSNDPINPDETVDLSGYGIYPQQYIEINSDTLNFGEVWLPQGGDGMTGQIFEIYNFGQPSLNLQSLTIDNPAFTCPNFIPGTLAMMDTLRLTIFFTPTQAMNYQGILTLTSDAVNSPMVAVTLQGSGIDTVFAMGAIIWSYQALEPATFDGFNSVKFMDDINGDDIPEVITANDNYLTYCINGQSAETGDCFYSFDTGWDPLRTGPVEYVRGLVSAPDLDNDGIGDFVLGTGGGSRSVFAVSGADGAEIWSFDTHNYGGEGGWVYEVTCEDDWNNDGIFDVLAGVGGPSGSLDPKSVFLLNGVTGDTLWRAHLGETVYSVRRLDDVNFDGYDEVICGTVNNTSDYFVKRLNGANGNVDWSHEVGYAVFSVNRIEDLNGDNITDVVAGAGFSGVYALSGINGNQLWNTTGLGTTYYLEKTEDINSNGFADVMVASVNGTLYALEGQTGIIIWSLPLGSNVLSLSVTPDVTGDGINDVCCGIMSGSFYAVSGANGIALFNYINGVGSNYAFDAVWWMPDIDNSGAVEFLGGTRDGRIFCFSGGTLAAPNLSLTLTPLNPPIVIPAVGGVFRYTAQAQNLMTPPINFDFWTMVELPNGTILGPLLLRSDITLGGGNTLTRTLTQNVPGGAPAGAYTYSGYVGDYDNNIIYDESEFSFDKVGAIDREYNSGWSVDGWEDSGVEDSEFIIQHSAFIFSASPNPFNATSTIMLELPERSFLKLELYNINGQMVRVIYSGIQNAGLPKFRFDAGDLPSGVYFCKMKAESLESSNKFSSVNKLILLK